MSEHDIDVSPHRCELYLLAVAPTYGAPWASVHGSHDGALRYLLSRYGFMSVREDLSSVRHALQHIATFTIEFAIVDTDQLEVS